MDWTYAQTLDPYGVGSRILGPSARIKFDDEQFAALFNELQARGDENDLVVGCVIPPRGIL